MRVRFCLAYIAALIAAYPALAPQISDHRLLLVYGRLALIGAVIACANMQKLERHLRKIRLSVAGLAILTVALYLAAMFGFSQWKWAAVILGLS